MKLYVGNLPWSINEDGLKGLFSGFEVSEASLIVDKFTRRSKGFGFVTIVDDAEAKRAIAELHEKDVEGRKITVSEAKPMVPRENNGPRRGGFDRGSRGPRRGGFDRGSRGPRRSFGDSEGSDDDLG